MDVEFFHHCIKTAVCWGVTLCQWMRITRSRAADLVDSSLLRSSAAAWQQSFSLVAKTVKFIPSHRSNCHRGERERRLSHLWAMAAHDNDPTISESPWWDCWRPQKNTELYYKNEQEVFGCRRVTTGDLLQIRILGTLMLELCTLTSVSQHTTHSWSRSSDESEWAAFPSWACV